MPSDPFAPYSVYQWFMDGTYERVRTHDSRASRGSRYSGDALLDLGGHPERRPAQMTDTAPFVAGMFIGRFIGRILPGTSRLSACPACKTDTLYQTRADEADSGRNIELEVCRDCGYVKKVGLL